MKWITTSTILNRLSDFEDRAMWNRFDGRFRPIVVGFGRKMGLSEVETDDVAQSVLVTFAEMYRRGEYDSERGRLSSWLFGIAYRMIASARRERARRKDRQNSTEFWSGIPDEHEASEVWDFEWQATALEHAENQVREEVQDTTYRAFRMVVREGLKPAEVGTKLGLSRDAVYVAKHRVLKRLREIVAEYDSEEGHGATAGDSRSPRR